MRIYFFGLPNTIRILFMVYKIMLELIKLDDRIVPTVIAESPYIGWAGSFDYDQGPQGQNVTVSGEGSPAHVIIRDNAGNIQASFYAFDAGFRGGGTIHAAQDRIMVAAGPGGGPAIAEFDYSGREITRYFANVPGPIAVGGFDTQVMIVDTGVPYDISANVRVQGPTLTQSEINEFRNAIAVVPTEVQGYVTGGILYAPKINYPNLNPFTAGLYLPQQRTILVNTLDRTVIAHEYAHAYDQMQGYPSRSLEWRQFWEGHDWVDAYARTNPQEGYAVWLSSQWLSIPF